MYDISSPLFIKKYAYFVNIFHTVTGYITFRKTYFIKNKNAVISTFIALAIFTY
nr:MAG TPA: hypothetical protein [Caudoviricetes sp.]DAR81630.1 MAG TPA: hypothetical protein [Caudoviricetes sp.]